MTETTINQRLKILLDALGLKIRPFSAALGVSEATTRNYLDRGSKPGADYLQKIAEHFERANVMWLLTGQGEPLLGDFPSSAISAANYQKNVSGNSVGINHGTTNQQQGDWKSWTEKAAGIASETTQALLIEHLKQQLAMKDQLLAAKDEIISGLKSALNRPS